jgi:MFS transporter, SP family, galactose:H+ symporter
MRTNTRFFLVILFASLAGLFYGYDLGAISGILLFISNDIPMTTFQISLVVAAVLGGGAFATIITGYLADIFGRKKMINAAAISIIVGCIVVITSTSFSTILLGRLIQVISIGIISITIPLYLSEILPSDIRGKGVVTFQLFITAGILLGYVVDLYFEETENWRAMFAAILIPGVIFLIGSFFLPKSPYSRSKTSFQKKHIKPFMLPLAISILIPLTGVNCILQYDSLMLKGSGLTSNFVSMFSSSGVGFINFITTILGLMLVDKVGRRPLLISGLSGLIVTLLYIIFLAQGYMLAVSFGLFMFFFAVGPGTVLWLLIAELQPPEIRSKGMGICLFINAIVLTIISWAFLPLSELIGYQGFFMICAATTLCCLLLAIYQIPETKNKEIR